MREKIGRRSAVAATSLALAATLAAPPAPAGAMTADNCHPPRYDTVHCVCVAVGRVWIALTGEDWACT